MQSHDSLEEIFSQTSLTDSELAGLFPTIELAEEYHQNLGHLPKDMELALPFDVLLDCIESNTAGRVEVDQFDDCLMVDNNNVVGPGLDHAYHYSPDHSSEINYDVVHIKSEPEEVSAGYSGDCQAPVSTRPRRQAVLKKQRYDSVASPMSDDEDEEDTKPSKQRKRNISFENTDKGLSKNAIAARENRERKKRYVSDLEVQVKELAKKMKMLAQQNDALKKDNAELLEENDYLTGVVANQPYLTELVKAVRKVPVITNVTTSLAQKQDGGRKRKLQDENAENVTGTRKNARRSNPSTSGICLHVSNGLVSIEHCHSCKDKARKGLSSIK
ncbi:CREB/ATF bZIP transcription factor [Halotydeus destructor]|nr:CREB/ATF bZIP transcription factor [Halotydeus destructor]